MLIVPAESVNFFFFSFGVFKAVCYLNNYGKDFKGGLFNFQDGEPKTIAPSAGVSAPVKIVCSFLFLLARGRSDFVV